MAGGSAVTVYNSSTVEMGTTSNPFHVDLPSTQNVDVGNFPTGFNINNLPSQGCLSQSIAAGTVAATVVRSGTGVFYGICVNSVGLGAPQAFDNTSASGKVLGSLVASAPIGINAMVPDIGAQFANGLTISGGATNPAMTVFFSF